MEENRRQLLALLQQKLEIFLEIERVSDAMLLAQADELAQGYDRRQVLLEKAALTDDELRRICADDAQARAAMNHEAHPEQGILKELHDCALNIRAAANRVFQNEEALRAHIVREQKRIRSEIEQLNKSGSTVAERYGNSVSWGIKRPLDTRNLRNL